MDTWLVIFICSLSFLSGCVYGVYKCSIDDELCRKVKELYKVTLGKE